MRIVSAGSLIFLFATGLSGCMESPGMSNPAMGHSAAEMSQMTGVPTAMLKDDARCARSSAILADPSSSANARYGATSAGRANGCAGF